MRGPTNVPTAQAVLLSGEHPTLPFAELQALLAVHDPDASAHVHGPIAIVQPGDTQATQAALQRMALAHAWGDLWATAPETDAGLHRLAVLVPSVAPRAGTVAVAATRRGTGKGLDRSHVERELGAVLKSMGLAIDLRAPQQTVFAWMLGDRMAVGLLRGTSPRGESEARISDERAHFSPVSLHPRRAASLLHLARVAPGGRVLDPFCGTGGLVLEAALEGYDAWGSDLDAFMVQGTLQTLADQAAEPLDGHVLQADIADVPNLVDGVSGIVTDFPYGRASSSHDEGLAALYDRAFAAFRQLLPLDAYAVVGCAQPELLPDLAKHGFQLMEQHAERVHRSLTRHYLVARRTG